MKKETLGSVLKERRNEFALTQRELAAKLGVKASHIAYLENGRRRPSLSLLGRIADTLDLDRRRLFLLAHPEARELITDSRDAHRPTRGLQAWRKFAANRAILNRYKVTPSELKVLRNVNLLGEVSGPRQFLFILNSIRQAVDEE
jgi:transcriptional regulator with XRE-family HTH domain